MNELALIPSSVAQSRRERTRVGGNVARRARRGRDCLEGDVHRALQSCGHPELGDVDVTVNNDQIVLRGRVSTYYLKQLAQNTVLHMLAGRRLCNELRVVRATAADEFTDSSDSSVARGARNVRWSQTDRPPERPRFDKHRIAGLSDAELNDLPAADMVELILAARPLVDREELTDHVKFYDRQTLQRLAFLVRRMCRQRDRQETL